MSLDIVTRKDDIVVGWVRERLPDPLVREHGFGLCTAIGVAERGQLIAGVVYHEYRGHSIQLSMASTSPRWCTKRTLGVLLGYPFKQLQVARITAHTAESNQRLRLLVERLGFSLEGTHPKAFDGQETLLTYGLLRDTAERWIADEKRTLSPAGA